MERVVRSVGTLALLVTIALCDESRARAQDGATGPTTGPITPPPSPPPATLRFEIVTLAPAVASLTDPAAYSLGGSILTVGATFNVEWATYVRPSFWGLVNDPHRFRFSLPLLAEYRIRWGIHVALGPALVVVPEQPVPVTGAVHLRIGGCVFVFLTANADACFEGRPWTPSRETSDVAVDLDLATIFLVRSVEVSALLGVTVRLMR